MPTAILPILLINQIFSGRTEIQIFSIVSFVSAGLLALLFKRFSSEDRQFDTEGLHPTFSFILTVSVIPILVMGLTYLISLFLFSSPVSESIGIEIWVNWLLGDILGLLVVTPLLWYSSPSLFLLNWNYLRSRRFELFLFLILISALGISRWLEQQLGIQSVFAFLLIPTIIWSCFRYGKLVSLWSILLLVVLRSVTLRTGNRVDEDHMILSVILPEQISMIILALTGLLLNGVLADREVYDRHSMIRQDRFKLALASTQVGIWDWDVTNESLYFDATWELIHGYERGELETKISSWEKTLHPEDREKIYRVLNQHVGGDDGIFSVEYRAAKKNGDWVWLFFRGKVHRRNSEGKGTRIIATVQDITERKNLENQFLRSQKMESIGRLTGGIAHDFNNILSVISGYAFMLESQLDKNSKDYSNVLKIVRATQRASDLIIRLLAFSRQQVQNVTLLSLNSVVDEAEQMLRRVIGEQVHLQVEQDPKLSPIKADAGQLLQIIMNLAINGRDAMPNGGSLVIRTRNVQLDRANPDIEDEVTPGRYVCLSVEDSGTGISDAIKQKIFEPFFTTKEAAAGTGLGLSTVFGLVKQSQGYIGLETAVGKGSKFHVYLPEFHGQAVQHLQTNLDNIGNYKGHETILLVEDEEDLRELIHDLLISWGYQVLEASSGEEALSIMDRHDTQIDLVMTDIIMPGQVDGVEMAYEMTQKHPETRFLFTSGYVKTEVVKKDTEQLTAMFLQKPFSATGLGQTIRAIIES